MTEPNDTRNEARAADGAAPKPARRRRLWILGGAAAAVATAASVYAHSAYDGHRGYGPDGYHGGGYGHHRGARGWGGGDPEAMARRIDRMVDWVLSDVGASDEQKARVATIAKQALADLAPLRGQHRNARREGLELLAAPTIDRAAIEKLRAGQLASMESASRRAVGAMVEIAEVLTPEQRARLKARIEHRWMHGRRG